MTDLTVIISNHHDNNAQIEDNNKKSFSNLQAKENTLTESNIHQNKALVLKRSAYLLYILTKTEAE